jgi:RNA polymerase sigma-70 factor, ECF subfamily
VAVQDRGREPAETTTGAWTWRCRPGLTLPASAAEFMGVEEWEDLAWVSRNREETTTGAPDIEVPSRTSRPRNSWVSRNGRTWRNRARNFPGDSVFFRLNDDITVARQLSDPSRQDEFAGFMRAYQDMVFSTAARITGRDGPAEDIAQQVFLKAYENFDHLRASPAAGGWLKTVSRNLALNHATRYRRRWRFFSEMRSEEDDDGEMEFPQPDSAVVDMDAGARQAIVAEALSQLPDHRRVPLVLYHFEEMSYDEIAKQLGISLAKVKIDILRARAALAKTLAARGLTADCF